MAASIVQIVPPQPVIIWPANADAQVSGMAHFLIENGYDHHLQWVVAVNATGEVWTVENPHLRFDTNWTAGRTVVSPLRPPPNKRTKD